MLQAADIRLHWDRIKGPIAQILESDGDRPEDVYADCRHGKAFLYVCEHGFVVLRRYLREDNGRPEVLIWLGYGEGGRELLAMYQSQLEDLARSVGADTLVFRTRRRGFERLADSRWRVRAYEYEMRVNHGK